jgi:hypothetical protein
LVTPAAWGQDFIEVAKLFPADGATADRFGEALAVSGERIVIGAPTDDWRNGSVYVFEPEGTDGYAEVARLSASDGDANDWFGEAVAVSGDRIVVGARYDDDQGTESGSAYVFDRDSEGQYHEVAKLLAPDGAAYHWFGRSVAVSGDRIFVGVERDDDLGSSSGSVYVFERDSSGSFTPVAKLIADDGVADDHFGIAIALAGERILVAAPFRDDHGGDSGGVYVFAPDGVGGYAQMAKLTAADGAFNDQFGISVAASADWIVVGALFDDDLGEDSGSAYVFEPSGSDGYVQVAKLTAADGAAGDHFGWSVAVSGEQIVVGATRSDSSGVDTGAAYLFEPDGLGSYRQVAKLMASDGEGGEAFGSSVAVSGERIVVGASLDDESGERSGAAYVFGPEPTSPGDVELVGNFCRFAGGRPPNQERCDPAAIYRFDAETDTFSVESTVFDHAMRFSGISDVEVLAATVVGDRPVFVANFHKANGTVNTQLVTTDVRGRFKNSGWRTDISAVRLPLKGKLCRIGAGPGVRCQGAATYAVDGNTFKVTEPRKSWWSAKTFEGYAVDITAGAIVGDRAVFLATFTSTADGRDTTRAITLDTHGEFAAGQF